MREYRVKFNDGSEKIIQCSHYSFNDLFVTFYGINSELGLDHTYAICSYLSKFIDAIELEKELSNANVSIDQIRKDWNSMIAEK